MPVRRYLATGATHSHQTWLLLSSAPLFYFLCLQVLLLICSQAAQLSHDRFAFSSFPQRVGLIN